MKIIIPISQLLGIFRPRLLVKHFLSWKMITELFIRKLQLSNEIFINFLYSTFNILRAILYLFESGQDS